MRPFIGLAHLLVASVFSSRSITFMPLYSSRSVSYSARVFSRPGQYFQLTHLYSFPLDDLPTDQLSESPLHSSTDRFTKRRLCPLQHTVLKINDSRNRSRPRTVGARLPFITSSRCSTASSLFSDSLTVFLSGLSRMSPVHPETRFPITLLFYTAHYLPLSLYGFNSPGAVSLEKKLLTSEAPRRVIPSLREEPATVLQISSFSVFQSLFAAAKSASPIERSLKPPTLFA